MAKTSAIMEPFEHERLSDPHTSIRLLRLEPATDASSPVCCTLKEAPLDAAKDSYEALSYTWGSPTGTQPLSCHGKAVLVTENCLSALKQLRLEHSPRTLWIDAICIDQSDEPASLAERGHQVDLMADVYRNASSVLVCLGPTSDLHVPQVFRRLVSVAKWSTVSPMKIYNPLRYAKKLVKRLRERQGKNFGRWYKSGCKYQRF
jgi:hypothetical protein